MNDVVAAAVKALETKLAGAHFDGVACFVVEDEGALTIDGSDVRAGRDEAADVTLTADAETFSSLLSGDLNPTSAFMSGRLKVDGDMGAAMRLGSVLG